MDFAFKVDVDTRQGLLKKVPAILDIFRESGIKASFFVPFGPDRSGVAVRRLWKRRGIVKKASVISPFDFYGLPTLLYGTLLPAPRNVSGAGEILRRITEEGHELGVHGYDHVEWHDRLLARDDSFMIEQIEKATEAYKKAAGVSPEGFAAPGWQMKEACYTELKKRGYLYSSSVRGESSFMPYWNGGDASMLEIPTTLPTLDELYMLFTKARKAEILGCLLSALKEKNANVHTIHAELEGGVAIDTLKSLVESLAARGVRFLRLKDLAAEILKKPLVIRKNTIVQGHINGRPGSVTCQR